MLVTRPESIRTDRRRGAGRRRAARLSVSFTAMLKAADRLYAAQVINISLDGAMVSCSAPVGFDDAVELDLQGQPPLIGHVTWQNGDRFGIAFAHDERSRERHDAWLRESGRPTKPQPDRRRT